MIIFSDAMNFKRVSLISERVFVYLLINENFNVASIGFSIKEPNDCYQCRKLVDVKELSVGKIQHFCHFSTPEWNYHLI